MYTLTCFDTLLGSRVEILGSTPEAYIHQPKVQDFALSSNAIFTNRRDSVPCHHTGALRMSDCGSGDGLTVITLQDSALGSDATTPSVQHSAYRHNTPTSTTQDSAPGSDTTMQRHRSPLPATMLRFKSWVNPI